VHLLLKTLDLLGLHEMEHDKNGKVVIPDPVENLFSLMDFDHDGKVSQPDFLRTTMHYRKLEKYLTIDLLERGRRGVQEKIRDMEAMIRVSEAISHMLQIVQPPNRSTRQEMNYVM
jgi:hypothetical protein